MATSPFDVIRNLAQQYQTGQMQNATSDVRKKQAQNRRASASNRNNPYGVANRADQAMLNSAAAAGSGRAGSNAGAAAGADRVLRQRAAQANQVGGTENTIGSDVDDNPDPTNDPNYPTTPAPLSASDIMQIDQRRAALARRLQEAVAAETHGGEAARTNARLAERGLSRQVATTSNQARRQAAARGMAFSPGVLGRTLRGVRDDAAGQRTGIQSRLAQRLAELAAQRQQAAQAKKEGEARLAQLVASRGADINQLI